jgi:molybdenum cofactor biosynthesis enzyme MoaA
MANLIITNVCNQKCCYCFADSYLQNNERPSANLSLSTFNKYLDYLDRSKIDQVRLLGGEPTLHPDFALFVKKSIQRRKNILIFSNGLMPESALQTLLEIPKDNVRVLVNVTPTAYHKNLNSRIDKSRSSGN